jgi:hypothetical protein
MTAMMLDYDPATSEMVVCAKWGPTSDWIRNIRARPALRVQIGRESFAPQHRFSPTTRASPSPSTFVTGTRTVCGSPGGSWAGATCVQTACSASSSPPGRSWPSGLQPRALSAQPINAPQHGAAATRCHRRSESTTPTTATSQPGNSAIASGSSPPSSSKPRAIADVLRPRLLDPPNGPRAGRSVVTSAQPLVLLPEDDALALGRQGCTILACVVAERTPTLGRERRRVTVMCC